MMHMCTWSHRSFLTHANALCHPTGNPSQHTCPRLATVIAHVTLMMLSSKYYTRMREVMTTKLHKVIHVHWRSNSILPAPGCHQWTFCMVW
jgi:hypothetical protein